MITLEGTNISYPQTLEDFSQHTITGPNPIVKHYSTKVSRRVSQHISINSNMNIINRLTKTFESVITGLFGGRRNDIRGDSRTPFDRYEERSFRDNDYMHLYERQNPSVLPQKSVGIKVNKSKGNV